MIDQCGNCILKGNLKECKEAPCSVRVSWFVNEQQKQIDEFEAKIESLKGSAVCDCQGCFAIDNI
ncbi:hypothetical protein KAR91_02045 [Candidatus Pacearchaeota archaeon]|nr:hypothetical protein [Candidatus Pacearchaeota archaeon]